MTKTDDEIIEKVRKLFVVWDGHGTKSEYGSVWWNNYKSSIKYIIVKSLSLKQNQQDELLNTLEKRKRFSVSLIAKFNKKVDEWKYEKGVPYGKKEPHYTYRERYNQGLEKSKEILKSIFTKNGK